LLGLALVLFFGIGYFRGWYTFNFSTGTDGKTNIQIGVDQSKLGTDLKDGKQWAGEKIDQLKQPKTDANVQPASGTQPAPASLPAPVGALPPLPGKK
jgi:hypothetical protein